VFFPAKRKNLLIKNRLHKRNDFLQKMTQEKMYREVIYSEKDLNRTAERSKTVTLHKIQKKIPPFIKAGFFHLY